MIDQTTYNYCAVPLANYACRPEQSAGRGFNEPESQYRTCFQRDRDRIIHSEAFRRLKYKTQVFVYHQGDHYRTRLTHTLEVAQIARSLARALLVNEDLAETIALAHDLGHPPFAHAGEDALNACMGSVGGFDHNDQSLRILTTLEHKYPDFIGLNLSWETLEGVVKHNGPLIGKDDDPETSSLPVTILETNRKCNWRLETYASVEAQIAALSDDIAYNSHDVEDGLNAGLFTLDDLMDVPFTAKIIKSIQNKYPGLSSRILAYETVREMIGTMVHDVLNTSKTALQSLDPQSAEDVRKAPEAIVAFSSDMKSDIDTLRTFLFERMYHHYTVMRTMRKMSDMLQDIYNIMMNNPRLLSSGWQKRLAALRDQSDIAKARIVADYIASMTDRYAIEEHKRLFAPYDG